MLLIIATTHSKEIKDDLIKFRSRPAAMTWKCPISSKVSQAKATFQVTGTKMCNLRPRSCSEGHKGPKVGAGAILLNTCVTSTFDASVLSTFANTEEEDIQRRSKVIDSRTMCEMQTKAVVRLARMQRDLMIVSSLEEEEEMLDVSKRSWLTSSSVLLALHSPLLASLLQPGIFYPLLTLFYPFFCQFFTHC